jgi:hypothetical protein
MSEELRDVLASAWIGGYERLGNIKAELVLKHLDELGYTLVLDHPPQSSGPVNTSFIEAHADSNPSGAQNLRRKGVM